MLNFLRYRSISRSLIKAHNRNRPKEKHRYICHAPFDSLRFNQSGIATVCCFNREHSLGRYPEDKLNQIWFGKKAEDLRKHLKHGDLNLGCFYCKNQIENREFESVKTKMYDHLPQREHSYPLQMEFELHNTCNLECIMCNAQNSSSIRKNRDKLPDWISPYNDDFVDQLGEFLPYLYQASFLGGEPFLIETYFKIWEKIAAVNPNMTIHVTTNGTILNDRVRQALQKGNFNFSISLESIREDTYGKIRVNGKVGRLLKNIDFFIDYCKKRGTGIQIWVCPLRQNWKEIPEIMEYFSVRNVIVNLHTVWFPSSLALWNLPSDQLKDIHAYYANFELKRDTEAGWQNWAQFNEYVERIKNWATKSVQREASPTPLKQVTELEEDFLSSLEHYVLSQPSGKRSERMEKWLRYKEKADNWISRMQAAEKGEQLRIITQYPIERIAGEFELWDKDELGNRLSAVTCSADHVTSPLE